MNLIKGFGRASAGFQSGSANRVGPGSGVATWQGGRWEEISHLNEVGSDSVGEKEKGGKEKERK